MNRFEKQFAKFGKHIHINITEYVYCWRKDGVVSSHKLLISDRVIRTSDYRFIHGN